MATMYLKHTGSRRSIENNFQELSCFVNAAAQKEFGRHLERCVDWMNYGVADSEDEAKRILSVHMKDPEYADVYRCYSIYAAAVLYYEYAKRMPASYTKAVKNAEKMHKRHYDLRHKDFLVSKKAEFVTCRGCKSKLTKNGVHKLWERELANGSSMVRCPLCGTDLRPQSVIDSVKAAEEAEREAYKVKWAEFDNALKAGRIKVMWLIQVEKKGN